MIECYIRVFKLNEEFKEEDEEIGFLSDFENENIYSSPGGFASDFSSLDDNIDIFKLLKMEELLILK